MVLLWSVILRLTLKRASTYTPARICGTGSGASYATGGWGIQPLPKVENGAHPVELRASEWAMILDGIDMAKLKRTPRHERRARTMQDSKEKIRV